ncbi:hypothetical protein CEUSTIGMA_g2292.t1 [Chlamydomonas eustigma]|uniref:DNA-directed DNA polymerase n=1 Tax=Chlamydomonas eustigma TaxID=1157962 RepID=A0A250WVQ6_9CHLO|nr:hypothetical protein CEUSTIGMA_g2292.t1 [Chlamydomonas eustigma]|eukprot:GAX74846.1 hypothetical protein CEUSTIGMA_g2292.t1 [Chlamydomonas eustigma]
MTDRVFVFRPKLLPPVPIEVNRWVYSEKMVLRGGDLQTCRNHTAPNFLIDAPYCFAPSLCDNDGDLPSKVFDSSKCMSSETSCEHGKPNNSLRLVEAVRQPTLSPLILEYTLLCDDSQGPDRRRKYDGIALETDFRNCKSAHMDSSSQGYMKSMTRERCTGAHNREGNSAALPQGRLPLSPMGYNLQVLEGGRSGAAHQGEGYGRRHSSNSDSQGDLFVGSSQLMRCTGLPHQELLARDREEPCHTTLGGKVSWDAWLQKDSSTIREQTILRQQSNQTVPLVSAPCQPLQNTRGVLFPLINNIPSSALGGCDPDVNDRNRDSKFWEEKLSVPSTAYRCGRTPGEDIILTSGGFEEHCEIKRNGTKGSESMVDLRRRGHSADSAKVAIRTETAVGPDFSLSASAHGDIHPHRLSASNRLSLGDSVSAACDPSTLKGSGTLVSEKLLASRNSSTSGGQQPITSWIGGTSAGQRPIASRNNGTSAGQQPSASRKRSASGALQDKSVNNAGQCPGESCAGWELCKSKVKNIHHEGVLSQLRRQLGACGAAVVCPLYCSSEGAVTAFHSPAQPLSRQQTDSLRKAKKAVNSKSKIAGTSIRCDGRPAVITPGSSMEDGYEIRSEVSGWMVWVASQEDWRCMEELSFVNYSDVLNKAQALICDSLYFIPIGHTPDVTAFRNLDADTAILKEKKSAPPTDSMSVQATGLDVSKTALNMILQAATKKSPYHEADEGSCNSPVLLLASNVKAMLKEFHALGVNIPNPTLLNSTDTGIMAWLAEPHLDSAERESTTAYSLLSSIERLGLCRAIGLQSTTPVESATHQDRSTISSTTRLVLVKLCQGTMATAVLYMSLRQALAWLPAKALLLECQVCAILAKLEGTGIPFDARSLMSFSSDIQMRLESISRLAASYANSRPFNLSSAMQLSQVLYKDLGLPLPKSSGRGAAKRHAPTDEGALRQLSHLHELPEMVLEHRQLVNFLSKYCEAGWVQAAATRAKASGYHWSRVACRWNQTQTATGRLSSAAPNLQAVTKYQFSALSQSKVRAGHEEDTAQQAGVINIRSAFVAPEGSVLISADYSQVELRILAHLSGDQKLVHLLRQAGKQGDAFNLIAASFLGKSGAVISHEDREKAKRVTYGIVYGIGPVGLAAQLQDQGVSVAAAGMLISSFLEHFSGVQNFIDRCIQAARHDGYVKTLVGRRRPMTGILDPERGTREAAERRAVNSTIQGSAADVIKVAMVNWCSWDQTKLCMHHDSDVVYSYGRGASYMPCRDHDDLVTVGPSRDNEGDDKKAPMKLLAQIHDELLFECESQHLTAVLPALKRIMEEAWPLDVPLTVRIQIGANWGTLVPWSEEDG